MENNMMNDVVEKVDVKKLITKEGLLTGLICGGLIAGGMALEKARAKFQPGKKIAAWAKKKASTEEVIDGTAKITEASEAEKEEPKK